MFVLRYVFLILAGSAALFLNACSTSPTADFNHPFARGSYDDKPTQCVPYAREKSGIQIYGDAHSWWNSAPPTYQRGHEPRVGAVLVLARTEKMRHGHLAVVKDLVSPRQINVTHSNWGNNSENRRITYDSMRAEDISPANDWTSIRFWNYRENSFGFPYKALGFIYK